MRGQTEGQIRKIRNRCGQREGDTNTGKLKGYVEAKPWCLFTIAIVFTPFMLIGRGERKTKETEHSAWQRQRQQEDRM